MDAELKERHSDNANDPLKVPDINVINPESITIEATSVYRRGKSKEEPDYEETRRLRRFLKLYFYNAFKWKNSVFSLHLLYCAVMVVQVIKVAVITDQMFRYGEDRANFSSLVNRGHTTLRHILLRGWDASWETLAYPPTHGDFADYDTKDIIASIDYAINRYYNVPNDAIGYYQRLPGDTMTVKMKYYDFGGFRNSQTGKLAILSKSFGILHPLHESNQSAGTSEILYSIEDGFQANNLSDPIKRLLRIELPFDLHSVRIDSVTSQARCLHIHGQVTFSDMDKNGQVLRDLNTLTTKVRCMTIGYDIDDEPFNQVSEGLGVAVMLFSILSLILTVATVVFAVFVFKRTKAYMKENYRKYYKPADDSESDLPASEYWRFVKLWDVVCLLGDIFTLYGTLWVIFRMKDDDWTIRTMDGKTFWLSIGNVLSWVCLLRYFKFHNKVHLLFTTIYRAMGNVLAYLLCVVVLFVGYWVSGYVMLGPYHVKFKTPELAASTLFTLIYADEIFATIHTLDAKKSGGTWVILFMRFYIYTFVIIFTVVVINILISIFINAYEYVKEYYKEINEDRELGPVEKALRTFLSTRVDANRRSNALRMSLCDLMQDKDNRSLSSEEGVLRKELGKLIRLSSTNNDVVLYTPRTLKAFIEDESDASKVLTCGCFRFKFVLFSNRGSGKDPNKKEIPRNAAQSSV